MLVSKRGPFKFNSHPLRLGGERRQGGGVSAVLQRGQHGRAGRGGASILHTTTIVYAPFNSYVLPFTNQ